MTWVLPKPRWECRNKREQEEMTAWVIGHIERRNEEWSSRSDYTIEDYEIDLARKGNPELLRARYPKFADLINPPKRPRGKRKHYDRDELMAGAEELVRFIKELWWREYRKKSRKQTNHPSAVDIVAEYFGFDAELIADRYGWDEKTKEELKLAADHFGYSEETTHKLADRINKKPKKKRGLIVG